LFSALELSADIQDWSSLDEESQFFSKALFLYCDLDTNASPNLELRYRQLLQQAFSSDSILQLICVDAIPFLHEYANGQCPDPRLTPLVPALGMIFMNLYSGTEPQEIVFSVETLLRPLCELLATRASSVFEDLVLRRTVIVEPTQDLESDNDVEKTGCCYGRQPYRVRPFYEGKDVESEHNIKDEGSCRKLYSTYSKNNLTGGLMALWCPHLVCLGFHKMPTCEGRNDVFSAILRYWEKAPSVIIYNFACQLGPYCMFREPEFFKNTLFAVDEMHANGHTQCSQACFVSNYMQVRSSLMTVNSSAAECSNKGLNLIRKSVSYMSQKHVILFTYVYLSVWNRKRELAVREEIMRQVEGL
jgi:hypothetical protein